MAQALTRAGGRAPSPALIGAALVVLTLAVRAQTFGNPLLGFDEQFYLLMGERMLHGALPYVDIFDRKPIGLFLIYAAAISSGGSAIIAYQLVAAAFAALTSGAILALARRVAPWPGALAAAALYLLWLDLTECEGGQSPVFYNLPVTLAAIFVARALDRGRIGANGAAAMLCVGAAIQIKYTVLFEGIVFGLALLWAPWRNGVPVTRLALLALLWIGCALAPTIIALGWYWHLGELPAFVFANFRSLAGRLPDPLPRRLLGLAAIALVLAPLVACVRMPGRASFPSFVAVWLAAALLSVIGFGAWLSVSYAAPVLVPVCIAAAPLLAQRRHVAFALIGLGLVAGQAFIAANIAARGNRAQALALAIAAQSRQGCLYVYDGPPALYLLTRSCLPTRWPFPGHLNTSDEASAEAIGADPAGEVLRIMSAHPETVVDTQPAYALGNPTTRAIVAAALARDYRLTFRQPLSRGRFRLVYRLRTGLDRHAMPGQ